MRLSFVSIFAAVFILLSLNAVFAVPWHPGPPINFDAATVIAPTYLKVGEYGTFGVDSWTDPNGNPLVDIDTLGDPVPGYDGVHASWTFPDDHDAPLDTVSSTNKWCGDGPTRIMCKWNSAGEKNIRIVLIDDHRFTPPNSGNSDDTTHPYKDITVTVDATAPVVDSVSDSGVWTTSTNKLCANWSAHDAESTVVSYKYAIGTSPTTLVTGWYTLTTTSVENTELALVDGNTYYFYVKAINGAGMESDIVASDGITVKKYHNAESEFSIDNNPNGWWSYGETANLTSFPITMAPFTEHITQSNGIERWRNSQGIEPSVTHNPDTNVEVTENGTTWDPGTLALSPGGGANAAVSIVRWTAPAAGRYSISARFWDVTGGYTSTGVHVLKNGAQFDPPLEGKIRNLNEGPTPRVSQPTQLLATSVVLAKNNTIEFAVDRGEDNNGDRDTTGLDVSISPAINSGEDGQAQYDKGLPSDPNGINSSTNRCNIRWADSNYENDYTKSYGDTFTLGSGSWVVDTIRVWTVPQIPIAPPYYLGSHYSSLELFIDKTDPNSSATIPSPVTADFIYGTNRTEKSNIFIMPTVYPVPDGNPGKLNYQRAAGDFNQIWQIDFNNLNWQLPTGTYYFGVHGTPRIDRLWFNHATCTTTHQFELFDFGLASPALVDTATGFSWFDGQYSEINIQVFAHRR